MKKFRLFSVLLLALVIFASVFCLASCLDGTGTDDEDRVIHVFFTDGETVTEQADAPGYFRNQSYRAPKAEERFGYTFEGWFNADGVKYFDAYRDLVPDLLLDRDITLYAKFTPKTYSFLLNAGDKSFEDGSTEQTLTAAYGEPLPAFPAPMLNDPAVAFDGYFDENGTRYSNGTIPVAELLDQAAYPNLADGIALFASYKPRTFTVTLDYNDGSLATVSFELAYGEELGDLAAYYRETAKEAVVGWSANPYNEVQPPVYPTEDIRLYAVWKPYKTVNFSMPDGSLQAQKIFEDTNRISLPMFEAPGYKLLGWHLTNSLSGNRVESVHYANMQDTYYGNWQVTDYAISFAGKGIELEDMRYYYGDSTVLPIPTVTGYAFRGWYIDDPENCFYSIPDTLWGDVTLTANMEANTYILSLNTVGGRLSDSFASVEYGANYTLPVPEKEGYTFLGWYDAARDGNRITNQRGVGLEVWSVAQNSTVLYAYWEPKSYVVAFNTDGGTSVAPLVYSHGDPFVPPAAPLKMGLLFNGWYTEDGATEYKDGTPITDNITLHAHWIESTPIFDAAGLLAIKDDPSGNYHLMNDINMGNATWAVIPEFSGILDGQGYKIYNLLLTSSSTANYAMIVTNRGTLRNLVLEEVVYNYNYGGTCSTGILTGINYGIIQNCTVRNSSMLAKISYQTKNSSASAYVAPIAGYNYGTVSGCFAEVGMEAHITTLTDYEGTFTPEYYYSNLYVGGLVGGNEGSILSCTAGSDILGVGNTAIYGKWYSGQGTFSSVAVELGGLVGVMVKGKIELSAATGSTVATWGSLPCNVNYVYAYTGGFIGVMSGGTVDRCYATGSVQGNSSGTVGHTGGFVGVIYNGASITNCYAETLVKSGQSTDKPAGFASYVAGVITDCYANSSSGSSGDGFAYQITSTGTIRNCFTAGANFAASNSGIVDKCFYAGDASEGAMKIPAELASTEFLLDTLYWDASVWAIDGENYPALRGLTDTAEEENGEEAA